MNRCVIALFLSLSMFMVPACATAHADTTDDAYLEVVREQGVHGSDASLIRMGHAVCTLREAGWTEREVASEIATQNPDLSIYQGGYVVGAAQAAFCPGMESAA